VNILGLDHVAIHVKELEKSCRFYREVLRLEAIPRPAFDFPGAWFRLGSVHELHLIGDRLKSVISHRQGNHFAVATGDLDGWERHFHEVSFSQYLVKQRPDGAGQIFLEDPDGHVIELCAKDNAADR
jgi:lactoylglutathione lyase